MTTGPGLQLSHGLKVRGDGSGSVGGPSPTPRISSADREQLNRANRATGSVLSTANPRVLREHQYKMGFQGSTPGCTFSSS